MHWQRATSQEGNTELLRGSRQALLALVMYSEGDDTALKSFRSVADSSLTRWRREEQERQ